MDETRLRLRESYKVTRNCRRRDNALHALAYCIASLTVAAAFAAYGIGLMFGVPCALFSVSVWITVATFATLPIYFKIEDMYDELPR